MSSPTAFNINIIYLDYAKLFSRNSSSLIYPHSKSLLSLIPPQKKLFYNYSCLNKPVSLFLYLFQLIISDVCIMSNIKSCPLPCFLCPCLIYMITQNHSCCRINNMCRCVMLCKLDSPLLINPYMDYISLLKFWRLLKNMDNHIALLKHIYYLIIIYGANIMQLP